MRPQAVPARRAVPARLVGFVGPIVRDADGIIDAMGGRHALRNPAQLVNRLPLTARIYESLWRVRSLGLLSGRPFPVADELAELEAGVRPALGPGAVVADVAASEGLYGRHLAHCGAEVVFIEHAVPFLRRALRRCAAEGISDRVDAVRALAAHLPFEDDCMDAVVMGGSLNEIGDEAAALAEMVRVLRPGGRLFLMSLVPATSRIARLAQALAGPGGIRFPTAGRTVAWLGPSMRVIDERVDGVVLRLVAEKVAAAGGDGEPRGPAPYRDGGVT